MPDDNQWSRRQWLKTAAIGTASLAGCSTGDGGGGDGNGGDGNGNGNGSGDGGDGGSGMVDRWLRVTEGTPPTQSQMNYWASGFHGELAEVSMPRFGRFSATKLKYVPLEASGWEVTDDKLKINLREGQVWTDGKKLTAEDWVVYFQLDRMMIPKNARDPDPVVTQYSAEDDTTFVCHLNTDAGYNEPAAEAQIINRLLGPGVRRGSVFEEKLNAMKEANAKERDNIRKEVTDISLKLPEVQMAGPYNPVSADTNEATFETNPDHGIAKYNEINWKGVKVKFLGTESPDKMSSAFASNNIDMHHEVVPPSVSMADHHQNVVHSESGGIAWQINYGYAPDGSEASNNPAMDILKDHRVHRAIAYALDRKSIASSAMPVAQQPIEGPPTGLLPTQVKEAFPDLYPKLDTYERTEENMQKAEQLMKDAGCSRTGGGKWKDPNGKVISVEVLSIPGSEWPGANQGVANWLKKFGIEATSAVISNTQVGSRSQAGRFQSILGGWGYGIPALFQAYTGAYNPQIADWQPPQSFKAPKEIGNWDSDLKEWKTAEIVSGLDNAPLEKTKEAVKKLVWVTNYGQPYFPLLRDGSGFQANTKTYEWPEMPPKDDETHYRFVPEGKSKYAAAYGFEQVTKEARRGHWGKNFKMQAKPK